MSLEREVFVNGHKLVALLYNEGGTNTPIIFMHGITSNICYWEVGQVPLVANELFWISLSLPGHYPAQLPSGFRTEDFSAEMLAEVLTTAIQELVGDRPVILVGHSTGGFAALAIAARTPDMVEGVICLSGFYRGQATGGLGTLQWLARHGAPGRALFKLAIKSLTFNKTAIRFSLRTYAADQQALNAWPLLEQSLEDNQANARELDANAMLPFFIKLYDTDISTQLPRMTAPTLVIAGDQDPVMPSAQAIYIAEQIPNSELVIMEGAGHLLGGERPTDYERVLAVWIEKIVR